MSRGVEAAAARAVAMVQESSRIGLGSGRAAESFVDQLALRVRSGLTVTTVATSEATATRARSAGLTVVELEDLELDLVVDGADEVSPDLDLVKGWGGALVRERIVAAAARRQIILVGPEKLVSRLGERGRIPIEVVPMAVGFVGRRLKTWGLAVERRGADVPYRTDNGNHVLDCSVPRPLDRIEARGLEQALLGVPGVVDTGLFLATADRVLVGHDDGRVEVRRRV